MEGQSKANNEGVNMLARVMQERMRKVSNTPPPMERGTIQNDYSLRTNKFPIPIPAGDYFVIGSMPTRGESVLVAWVDADPVVIGTIKPAGVG